MQKKSLETLMKNKRTVFAITALLTWVVLSSYTPVSVRRTITDITSVQQERDSENTANQRFLKVLDINLDSNTFYEKIDFGFTYTSFVFEVPSDVSFINTYYVSSNHSTTFLDSVPVGDIPSDVRRSPFVIPETEQTSFSFYSGKLHGTLRLFLFFAPPLTIEKPKSLNKAITYCSKPELITGEVWREGLPEPVGTRTRHEVAHCIIHHAASSNSNKDYVNVVRNIFLLHTQTNGWDDIGYNFVIAQDGTVFEGREHQDIDSTDNIMGAHFCGKNTGTMGICMLGNYQETSPSTSSLESLKHLITWKCYIDKINPLGSSAHPTSSSNKLNHIAGHQDGCATACPGDSLYILLPKLRITVDSLVKTCNASKVSSLTESSKTFSFTPSKTPFEYLLKWDASLEVNEIIIYNNLGQRIITQKAHNNHGVNPVTLNQKGIFVIRLLLQNGTVVSKKISTQ